MIPYEVECAVGDKLRVVCIDSTGIFGDLIIMTEVTDIRDRALQLRNVRTGAEYATDVSRMNMWLIEVNADHYKPSVKVADIEVYADHKPSVKVADIEVIE